VTIGEKPWLEHYPPAVVKSILPVRYKSLAELCTKRCADYPQRTAFENLGATLTYAEFEHASRNFAAFLSNELGLLPGDRVAVMLPNLLQSPVVLLGILRAGLVAVSVNPLYTAPEVQHQVSDSGARVVVVLENFASTLSAAMGPTSLEFVIVARVGDALGAVKGLVANFVIKYHKRQVPAWDIPGAYTYIGSLERGARLDYEDPSIAPDEIAFLQYTGGTTGVAKGAMLTHANMISNVLQLAAWVDPFIESEKDVSLTPLPLYHIFGLTVNLFTFIELGAKNVLITNPRDIKAFVAELKRGNFAFLTGVNTLFNALIHAPGIEKVNFSNLKIVLAGGMAVQSDVAASWKRLTGVTITQGYGLTETSPVVSASPLNQTEFSGSIGLPLPDTDIAILDEAGHALPPGEVGEIGVKGPQVMRGYWQRPEETSAAFTSDGWLKTGDLGRMDERGFFFIEDRIKDVIIVSGFNVYPNEVEDVVTSHPEVLEAAAVGVPSERSGQAVKIFVVRKNPELSATDLLAHCRKQLTGYKSPDVVEFVDSLPKSNVGKVLRRKLKELKTD